MDYKTKHIAQTIVIWALLFLISLHGYAQETTKKIISQFDLGNWQHLDHQKDAIPGVSLDRVYTEILKDKKAEEILDAVLDSDIFINHEDLHSGFGKSFWIEKSIIGSVL